MNRKTKPDLEHGYVCKCGKYNIFTAWVYAHLDIEIHHTCECGRKNVLLQRNVMYSINPKTKKVEYP